MGLTTDRNDPGLNEIEESGPFKGQQKMYLVLSEEERAKGFVRPYRDTYRHLACGGTTHMGKALSETYARNPKFYGGTFCAHCGDHFPLHEYKENPNSKNKLDKYLWVHNFEWVADNAPVGD